MYSIFTNAIPYLHTFSSIYLRLFFVRRIGTMRFSLFVYLSYVFMVRTKYTMLGINVKMALLLTVTRGDSDNTYVGSWPKLIRDIEPIRARLNSHAAAATIARYLTARSRSFRASMGC